MDKIVIRLRSGESFTVNGDFKRLCEQLVCSNRQPAIVFEGHVVATDAIEGAKVLLPSKCVKVSELQKSRRQRTGVH